MAVNNLEAGNSARRDEDEELPEPLPATRALVDFALIVSAGIGVETILRLIGPYERGFFCNDESIRLPYRTSTVSGTSLFAFCFLIPAIAILAGEYFRLLLPRTANEAVSRYERGRNKPSRLVIRFATFYGYFLIAFVATNILTGVSKYPVGRLRPHFIDVCRPNVNLTNCSQNHDYIVQYECLSNTPKLVKEARLSFFSGHSSLSLCTVTFVVLYLQCRLRGLLGSHVVVPLIQVAVFSSGLLISYSRIFDHQHHWSDVLIGMLIGIGVSTIVTHFVAEMKLNGGDSTAEECQSLLQSSQRRYTINSQSTNVPSSINGTVSTNRNDGSEARV